MAQERQPRQDPSASMIVHEGWLIKSPPSKRVWRPKWRRRWFALRQSAELPGQYFLDYYSDSNSRKLKGTIDLELCEQVDAGLRMQRRSNEGTAVKGSVFSIRTQSRIYHLEADCVTEMEKWVDVICRVCGMKSTDDTKFYTRNNDSSISNEHEAESGPYIPISECITGPPKSNHRNQNPSVFNFNERLSNNSSLRENDKQARSYMNAMRIFNNSNNFTRNALRSSNQPPQLPEHIYQNAENIVTSKHNKDSVRSVDNLQRRLERFSINDGHLPGTSIPPRPPKPSYLYSDAIHKDSFVGPRISEPNEMVNNVDLKKNVNYLNLSTPPAVNRGLKPRPNNHHSFIYDWDHMCSPEPSPKLQYLDLDLDCPSPDDTSFKSRTETESPTVYKTVDFLKTEALNMTRMDTEAYRKKDVPSK